MLLIFVGRAPVKRRPNIDAKTLKLAKELSAKIAQSAPVKHAETPKSGKTKSMYRSFFLKIYLDHF